MLMGRSVLSQRLAREWILFLLFYGEETRGFFLVSVRLLASPVSSCCVALIMTLAWSRRLQCRTQFASFFLACCPVCLGWPAREFLSFFTVCCTDIGLSGSKERKHVSSICSQTAAAGKDSTKKKIVHDKQSNLHIADSK